MSENPVPRPRLDDAGAARCRAGAHEFADEHGLEDALAPIAPHRWRGTAEEISRPTLHLDDVSAIPFLVDIAGVEEYQHRGRLRAGSGDLFATVTRAAPGYEEYCRERLGLGTPTDIIADPGDAPLAVAEACRHGEAFGRLVERARASGGFAIHPYMGNEAVWGLAHDLTERAGVPVSVLGPPPPVTWVANDKMLLSSLVERTAGPEAIVETRVTGAIDELVLALLDLATRHPKVALKRLRCASAMGNAVFDATSIAVLPPAELAIAVASELRRMEWDEVEPVLAVAWEETDESPSTQWWIPPRGAGTPHLDGIYDQILEGSAGVFVGSRPSRLPQAVQQGLADICYPTVLALQELGYVGRCSFDHLVVGDAHGEPVLRTTECNGRWGGTSTPMSFVDRLRGAPRPSYRAQDVRWDALVGMPFPEVLERLGDALYDHRTGEGWCLVYNVGPLETYGKCDVIALGETQEEAERRIEEELPALLGV